MAAEQAPGDERPYLRLRGIQKQFGAFTALKGIDLDIHEREFVCCLGPSGCGKTTLLRAVAGLDIQSAGTIEQAGRDISTLPVSQRDFGIVFQSYALFPNLTVRANVGYGLTSRGIGREQIDKRVAELLQLVGLPDSAGKYPAQLSGGQQQRIALARALAPSPGLLLLDEPLSALDARVRIHLRHEIKQLQNRLGVTTIMVTHDQEEALTMADRIVVMNHGVIEQVGSPLEIYRKPTTAFVAGFVGTMNFLKGNVIGPGRVRMGAAEIECGDALGAIAGGTAVTICIRPEDIAIRNVSAAMGTIVNVTITELEFLGSFFRANLAIDGQPADQGLMADFSINAMNDLGLSKGKALAIALPRDRLGVFAA
ncbi:MAG: putative 2-aminoethylphosphonate ABC transporter ATP-binding protein [Alphaproteobacteria bacterium]|nr:putative 2-aminoethylphosphonate ABC transporter ATP-binding protein [Alphaproteobacteria bacterium]